MEDKQVVFKGMGFWSILQLLLIVFKLLGITMVATWSWWLVLLPMIVSVVLTILAVLLMIVYAVATY